MAEVDTNRSERRRLLRFVTLMPRVLSIMVAGIASLVLLGWYFGMPALTGASGGKPPMLPVTAICFIGAALSLYLAQFPRFAWTQLLSRLVALALSVIAIIALLEYTWGWQSGIDAPFRELVKNSVKPTGIMANNSALAFAFFAQALLFLKSDRATNGLKSQLMVVFGLTIAFLALVGHIFGVKDFYSFQVLSGMSLFSAIAFTLLGFGILFSHVERGFPALVVDDGAAGFVARRLLPGALFIPFIFTMARMAGEEREIIGPQLGASLVAVADMMAFLLLIAWSARVLRLTDRRRGELLILEREAREASERARADAEIARAQAEIARAQAEAARAEAESANGAKSDFLAVMSHELRTPLAAIMGYQELLADGITGPINEQQAQQLGRIKASARHLLSLIDEVLTFTRLDAGRERIEIEAVSLASLLSEAAELIDPLAKAKNLELIVDSPEEAVIVRTDPTKVRQMLVNLLSNAVKFTDKGTVRLSGKSLDSEIHLSVSDTGIGIPAEHHHRIFEPFWQVEQKATRRASGTGLGLTVTRRLANLLGGDVTVQSSVGEGTTFTITLPTKTPDISVIPQRAERLRAG
ncbi:MAG TPA: HAMP domain-containing sensor histidine kinase [Gemmatimonadaceae bacterium]|nr:HAMP domain-containing sensor histidine kinase [Gemmatimonadaceae bacterium]